MLTLRIYQGFPFLGGRQIALKTRNEALQHLAQYPDDKIVIDFANVSGVSHGFADELLSPLSETLGDNTSNKITIINCDSSVHKALICVGKLQKLNLPYFA